MVSRELGCEACTALTAELPARALEELDRWIEEAISAGSGEAILERACRSLIRLIAADRSSVLVSSGRHGLRVVASSDSTTVGDQVLALERHPELEHVLRWHEPILVPDAASSELLAEVRGLLAAAGITSMAAVPFHLESGTGVLHLSSRSRAFAEADLRMLAAAAHLAEHALRRQRDREGEERPVELRPAVNGADREANMRATILRQQQELLELRRQLEQATTARAAFLSASAHELKTPLSVIQSYLETLTSDLAEGLSPEQQSFLRISYEAVLRLRRLVLDLVDLAALDSGSLHLEITRVEVEQVVASVLADMAPIALRAGVMLEMSSAATLPPIRGDRERVEQVLRNLVDNAVKFTPPGGQVLVHGQVEQDSVVLTVEDTGGGIPEDQLTAIFDEFVRLRQSAPRSTPGSGLGLPICRRIVRSLGGRIAVDSSEGKGAAFMVYLPRWPDAEEGP